MLTFAPTLAIILGLTTLLAGGIMVLAPQLAPPAVVLGVRVPKEQRNHPVVRQQQIAFRKRQSAVAIVAAVLAVPAAVVPVLGGLLSLLPVAFFVWNLNHSAQPIREAKQQEGWFDGVRTTVAGKIFSAADNAGTSDITEIEGYPRRAGAIALASIVASMIVLLVAAGYVSTQWQNIPNIFATHFGSGFQPDGWSEKSVGSVFFPTFFCGALVAGFGLLVLWMFNGNVPARSDSSLSNRILQDIVRKSTAMWLALLTLAMVIMFAAIQVVLVIPAAMDKAPIAIMVGLVLVVGTSLVMIAALASKKSALQPAVDRYVERVASTNSEGRDNDEHYKWGMFYYNPDDPAVMVEKRFGFGMDFNYAHWQGKAFITAMLLMLVGCVALPVLL